MAQRLLDPLRNAGIDLPDLPQPRIQLPAAPGKNDIVISRTWNPLGTWMSALLGYERWGIAWYDPADAPTSSDWQIHNVSGPRGIKFDRIVLHDLDGDTDLDAVTTEEKMNDERGLGVVWYENPKR